MSTSFGLRVSPAGTHNAIDPATGQHVDELWGEEAETAVAYLPHQCDQWIIGVGDTGHVIGELRRMRDEIDAAIAYLTRDGDPDRAPAEPLPADVVQRQGDHRYLSTACWHGLHPRCRDTCKFCGVACRCSCHEEPLATKC